MSLSMPLGLERNVAWLAIAVGVVALVSLASLALFYAVGTPYGAINDWTVGGAGLLSGVLVVMLHRRGTPVLPAVGMVATGAGVIGAVIVAVGAALRAKWKQGPVVFTEVTAYERPNRWTY
ncbi:MAG: hypothetical protein ABIZ52_05655 [Candidatus Limnocylindrales bacterium]